MAERTAARRRPAYQRPVCLPWMDFLRGCIPCLYKETQCSVCRERIKRREKTARRDCCGERFHQRCLEVWRESGRYSTCPGCDADLDPPPPPPLPRFPWPLN
ncbi:hypothetical protein ABZP36_007756 [Zizania latifolia]